MNENLNAADRKALDLLADLPGGTGKVAGRANAGRGIFSTATATRLAAAGRAVMPDAKTIVLAEAWEEDPSTPDSPPDDGQPIEVPDTVETGEPAAPAEEITTPEEPKDKAAAKVNGRKAKAEASPYSTAPVTGFQKRHGKSRRTGTETQILDLLHAKGKTLDAKAHDRLVAKTAAGRYRVECMTHGKHKDVPDMTTAKPLQARTDEFCQKCVTAVKARTEAPQATDAA